MWRRSARGRRRLDGYTMTQTSVDVNAVTSVPSAVTYGPLATAQSHRTATASSSPNIFCDMSAAYRSTSTEQIHQTITQRTRVRLSPPLKSSQSATAVSRMHGNCRFSPHVSLLDSATAAVRLRPNHGAAHGPLAPSNRLLQLPHGHRSECHCLQSSNASAAQSAESHHAPPARLTPSKRAHAATSSARMATARHRLNLAATAQARRTAIAQQRLTVTARVPTVIAQARLTVAARATITSRAEDALLVATTDARMTTRARLVAAAHTRTAETSLALPPLHKPSRLLHAPPRSLSVGLPRSLLPERPLRLLAKRRRRARPPLAFAARPLTMSAMADM